MCNVRYAMTTRQSFVLCAFTFHINFVYLRQISLLLFFKLWNLSRVLSNGVYIKLMWICLNMSLSKVISEKWKESLRLMRQWLGLGLWIRWTIFWITKQHNINSVQTHTRTHWFRVKNSKWKYYTCIANRTCMLVFHLTINIQLHLHLYLNMYKYKYKYKRYAVWQQIRCDVKRCYIK